MNIIIQGLRRSGTTILYDILSEDKKITSFYEPLCMNRKTLGGGSKEKKQDLSQPLRVARQEFYKEHKINPNNNNHCLNFGAPQHFKCETSGNPPSLIKKYLKHLLNYSENSLLKFTRATFLVKDIHELDPSAIFIHIVKEPERWATSHICNGKYNIPLLKNATKFFGKKGGFNRWGQENIVNFYLKKRHPQLLKKPAYYKLLYLHHHFNKITEKAGRLFYGERYIKVNYEDLCKDPQSIINKIYLIIGHPPPPNVVDWAQKHIRPPKEIIFKNNKQWKKAKMEISNLYENKTIISLTTIPSRLPKIRPCLESLSKQGYPVYLWLPKYFKRGKEALPEVLPPFLDELGINYEIVEDYGSITKLLPALNLDVDYIITADDDVIYGKGWADQLIAAALKWPNKVISFRGRVWGKKNKHYKKTKIVVNPDKAKKVDLVNGLLGVIYQPRFFKKSIWEEYKKVTWADDLVISHHLSQQKIGVYVIPLLETKLRRHYDNVCKIDSLWSKNKVGGNDEGIKEIWGRS